MSLNRRLFPLAMVALAAVAALSGCKNSGSQSSQSAQQNSAGQPAAQNGTQASNAGAQPGMQSDSTASQAPPAPTVVDLPDGTRIRVRLDQDLGSKISQTGDSFRATVVDDVVVSGQTVIPSGAHAEGVVVDAKPLGRFKGGARLELRLERVHTSWGSYPVATSSIDRVERGKGKRSAILIGGGAGLGTLIGGLAGGKKGALIGGLSGAGAGTAGSAFTGNKQIFLPSGTLLSFHLEHSVHVTEQ